MPLNKIDCFCEIMEENSFRFASCDNLCDYHSLISRRRRETNPRLMGGKCLLFLMRLSMYVKHLLLYFNLSMII